MEISSAVMISKWGTEIWITIIIHLSDRQGPFYKQTEAKYRYLSVYHATVYNWLWPPGILSHCNMNYCIKCQFDFERLRHDRSYLIYLCGTLMMIIVMMMMMIFNWNGCQCVWPNLKNWVAQSSLWPNGGQWIIATLENSQSLACESGFSCRDIFHCYCTQIYLKHIFLQMCEVIWRNLKT